VDPQEDLMFLEIFSL